MSNPTICLWSISNEPEYVDLTRRVMESYSWITRQLLIDPARHGFGEGIEVPLEHGGLRQVGARNYAISLAEQTGCEWLLQCDADDFFMEETIELFLEAERLGKDSIRMSHYRFQEPRRFQKHRINAGVEIEGCRFDDPHVIAWRTSTRTRFTKGTPEPGKNAEGDCNPCGFLNTLNIRGDEIFHVGIDCGWGAKSASRRVPREQTHEWTGKRVIPDWLAEEWLMETGGGC